MIDRAVRPVPTASVPRILRPFKERIAEQPRCSSRRGCCPNGARQRAATLGSVLKSAVIDHDVRHRVHADPQRAAASTSPRSSPARRSSASRSASARRTSSRTSCPGMFMLLEDQYGVGDVIDFEKATGTVEAVGLRITRLRDVNGTVWYVRNGEVVRVGNKSQGFATVVLDVPIDAWADLAAASQAMLDVAHDDGDEEAWKPVFLSEPEVQGVETDDPRGDGDPPGRPGAAARAVAHRARAAPPDPRAPGHASTSTAASATPDGSAAGAADDRAGDRAERPQLSAPQRLQHGPVQGRERVVHGQHGRHRHLGVDGQREHAEQLAAVRPDDGGADEHAAVGVLDHLDEAVVARARGSSRGCWTRSAGRRPARSARRRGPAARSSRPGPTSGSVNVAQASPW